MEMQHRQPDPRSPAKFDARDEANVLVLDVETRAYVPTAGSRSNSSQPASWREMTEIIKSCGASD